MRKTSVYLSDDEAEGLRRLAVAEGRAQAELIREGIRRVIEGAASQPRRFRSLGRGSGGGTPYLRWASDELYRRKMGDH
jgi:hypothetical protein